MTTTTHYGWTLPTVGADADVWGTELNSSLSGIDTTMFGKLDLAGGTMTGLLTLKASTNTVAALNIPTGVLLTTAVVGAVEFDGAQLYFTASGPTRKTLANLSDNQTFAGNIAVSGTLTATLTGNASTATKLATARSLAITGDLTWTSPAFDGSGNVTAAGTLATVYAGASPVGGATAIPVLTIDGKGRITATSTAAINSATTSTAGILKTATAAQVATGTDATVAVTPAALAAATKQQATCYATISGGVVSNVATNGASITRTGTGSYRVDFSPAMPNANYSLALTAAYSGANINVWEDPSLGARSISSAYFSTRWTGGSFDASALNVIAIAN